MNFGEALHELKAGRNVAREGWNAKGIFIRMQISDVNSKMTRPYLYINTTDSDSKQKVVVPWLPGQSDIFAEDWEDVGC
jgi:hypothetical protein